MNEIDDNIYLDVRPSVNYLPNNGVHTLSTIIQLRTRNKPQCGFISNRCFIIAVDISRHTTSEKLKYIKLALTYFLDCIDETCYISLIIYNTELFIYNTKLVNTTSENVKNILEYLGTVKPRGESNIELALNFIANQSKQFTQSKLVEGIIITTGTTISLTTNSRLEYPINIFSIGRLPDARLLINFCSKTAGGRYYHTDMNIDFTKTIGEYIGYLKSILYNNVNITIDAFPGARIVKIAGVGGYKRVEKKSKTVKIVLGSLTSSMSKSILVILSVRKLSTRKNEKLREGWQYLYNTRLTIGNYSRTIGLEINREIPSISQQLPLVNEYIHYANHRATFASFLTRAVNAANEKDYISVELYICDLVETLKMVSEKNQYANDLLAEVYNIRELFADYKENRNTIYAIIYSYSNQITRNHASRAEKYEADTAVMIEAIEQLTHIEPHCRCLSASW